MNQVNEARNKVNEAIEILAALARIENMPDHVVRELDDLCNDLMEHDEVFDYLCGIVP